MRDPFRDPFTPGRPGGGETLRHLAAQLIIILAFLLLGLGALIGGRL